MKKGNDQYGPYLFMAGVVAMVAIVALVLNGNGNLEGAPVFEITEGNFQKVCTDDDPDDDFFKVGSAQLANKVYKDYCSRDGLVQHHCKTGKNIRPRRPYECPNGCLNGACIR